MYNKPLREVKMNGSKEPYLKFITGLINLWPLTIKRALTSGTSICLMELLPLVMPARTGIVLMTSQMLVSSSVIVMPKRVISDVMVR